ncbi:hypothetical protein C8T65DRAFT_629349 [Cerioporus squamosus]|nr:hypothetical protein C8T65DRAFT_629349 [Cerioporus squamosus]
MAKSTRSKVKRHFRAKKREEGVYAATEAARLQRLNMKLRALTTTTPAQEKAEDEMPVEGQGESEWQDEPGADGQRPSGAQADSADAMDLDAGAGPSSASADKRISTHGPRNSRREQWRASKGMPARPKSRGMNRQGTVAAKRKSGRSHRRR